MNEDTIKRFEELTKKLEDLLKETSEILKRGRREMSNTREDDKPSTPSS